MSSNRRVVLQLIASDGTGDTLHRMGWPAQELAKQAPDWLIVNLNSQAVERLAWGESADLLVVFQTNDPDLLRVIHRRRERGLKTLVEYNDNFYEPPPSSPSYHAWSSRALQASYEEYMRAADGIITTCKSLVDLYRSKVEKPCHILKNHLPFMPELLDDLTVRKTDPFAICWAGSIGHAADLIAVTPTIRKFLAAHPTTVFHLMGNDALPNVVKLPSNQLRFQDWGSMSTYFTFLEQAHVGIVPLIETPYNRCRSDIKAIEMVGRGVLPLLPAAAPYLDFIEATGVPTWETFSELEMLLERYHKLRSLWRSDLERCMKYVREQRVGINETSRLQLYRSYMPAEAVQQSLLWPQQNGFLQVTGTNSSTPLSVDISRAIRAKLKRGDNEEAARLIDQSLTDFDGNPDLALECVEALLDASQVEVGLQVCEQCKIRFPLDFRFHTVVLQRIPDDRERLEEWLRVLKRCETWQTADTVAWENHLVAIWRVEPCAIHMAEVAKLLEKTFPDNYSLIAYNVMLAVERGDTDASLRCDDLGNRYRTLERNKEFLNEYTEGYWRAYSEGIRHRVEERLGWRKA